MANNKRFFKTISLAHWHVKLSIAAQLPMVLSFRWEQTCELGITGGHFACACVNPLNNNSVDASNLMAGNRKLARKVAGLLKAISLVL